MLPKSLTYLLLYATRRTYSERKKMGILPVVIVICVPSIYLLL
jgi:hypothetical protein